MFGKVISISIYGIDGIPISVEADVSDGLPIFEMVGVPCSEVKEAKERVRTAFKNCGIFLPPKRITINLSPADIRKKGTGFDFPIAVAILTAMDFFKNVKLNDFFNRSVFCGELSLDGSITSIRGILPAALCAKDKGLEYIFIPKANIKEAAHINGIKVIGVESLIEFISIIHNINNIDDYCAAFIPWKTDEFNYSIDFSDVTGQLPAKRAIEIAAAGMHNILFTGPPGSGKSMLAKRIPTILPPLNYEESLEITRIYSVCGLINDSDGLIKTRPFRSPHHTITPSAFAGGGLYPMPGEISLANRGILFLDELPEFPRKTLEVLRQPMEDKKVFISRLHGRYEFPANTMIVAAANPCPCGYHPDTSKCKCSPYEIKRYNSKLSGPLLDRIDINIEVTPINKEELLSENLFSESSKTIRKRVLKAHQIQAKRFKDINILFNSQMDSILSKRFCKLDNECKNLMNKKLENNNFSTRSYYKILKIARTIADLEDSKSIKKEHIIEALCYR